MSYGDLSLHLLKECNQVPGECPLECGAVMPGSQLYPHLTESGDCLTWKRVGVDNEAKLEACSLFIEVNQLYKQRFDDFWSLFGKSNYQEVTQQLMYTNLAVYIYHQLKQ